MSRREYKKAVDKIVCTDAFREKMEEKLSLPASESHEYADSVSEVERARPRNIKRILGVAAACGVVCVSIGIGYNAYKNSDTDPMDSSSYDDGDSSSISVKYENLPSLIQNFPDMEWGVRYDGGESIRLSYEQKEALAEMLNKTSWDTDIAMELDGEPNHDISLNLLDSEMWYLITLYDNGYITEKYALSNDDVDCFSDNYWTAEDYEEVYKLLFGNEEQTVTDEVTEDVTEEETTEAPVLSDTEFVCELLDEQLSVWDYDSEYVSGRFLTDAGQYSDWVSFMYSHDDLNNLKYILKSCEWEQIDDSSKFYKNFYIMKMSLNEEGYLNINTDTANYYFKTDNEQYLEVVDYIHSLKNDKMEYVKQRLLSFRSQMLYQYEYAAFSADAYIKIFNDSRYDSDDKSSYTVKFSSIDEKEPNAEVYYDLYKDESYIKFTGTSSSKKYDNKVYNVCSEWLKKDGKTLYVETHEEDSDIKNYENSLSTLPNEINSVAYGNDSDEIPFDYFGLYSSIPQLIHDLQADIDTKDESTYDYCTYEQYEYDENGEYIGLHEVYSIFSAPVNSNENSEWVINLTLDNDGTILMYEKYSYGELVESIELDNLYYEFSKSDSKFPEYPEIYDTLINK